MLFGDAKTTCDCKFSLGLYRINTYEERLHYTDSLILPALKASIESKV